jgi:PST family polysaccharide transporter
MSSSIDIEIPTPDVSSGKAVEKGSPDPLFSQRNIGDLRRQSAHSGVIAVIAQAVKFVLQTGTVIVLARLLTPKDFGLQGMVLVMTGFLGLLKDAGLSMATVQRDKITHDQVSCLFWINVGLGCGLMLVSALCAPALAAFYKEPRLYSMTVVSATAFFFNGLATQHQALLQRNLSFMRIAIVDVTALVISSVIAVVMAAYGAGYWALVGMVVSSPVVTAIGSWIAVPWLPSFPRRRHEVGSMLHFGGTMVCNSIVVYLGYNIEKILLGRFWGAEALGIYGRGYQLVNLPVQQLNNSLGSVAFSALARLQNNTNVLCRSFLAGYSMLLSVTLPVTALSAIFAEEIVIVLLGPKWRAVTPVFRSLTPAILGFALINPFGWFLSATGRAGRSLRIAMVLSPIVIVGIVSGLSRGPNGVAIGYSAAITLLTVPVIAWSINGTGIGWNDYWESVKAPVFAGLAATCCGLVFEISSTGQSSPVWRLAEGGGLMLSIYLWMLLYVMERKKMFMAFLSQLKARS